MPHPVLPIPSRVCAGPDPGHDFGNTLERVRYWRCSACGSCCYNRLRSIAAVFTSGVLTLLSIFGAANRPFCDGLSRRSFLSAGSLAFGGLTLPDVLRAQAAGAGSRDHSVVMIYLPGRPTQHETFDPKPNAPKEIRGSFSPISTSLPGVQFCELLPNLARMADRFSSAACRCLPAVTISCLNANHADRHTTKCSLSDEISNRKPFTES
jgi:hypothetical protein